MSRLSLLWITVSCSALASCSSVGSGGMAGSMAAAPQPVAIARSPAPAPTPSPPLCGGGQITDVRIRQITPSGPDVTVRIPATVRIEKNKAGARWTIETAGYAFASSGVAFKADQPGGLTSAASISTTEYVWCFNSTRASSWDYGVYLTAVSANSPTWYCDPTIVNFGSLLEVGVAAVLVCRPV